MKKTLVSAFGFIIFLMVTAIAFAAPVPDTGQTKCYNASVEITCPSSGQPFYGQDANYTINPMSYTKLDGSGNVLSDSATSWVMVEDNVTGLIWEMKTNKDGVKNYSDQHDADNTYTWYDSNPATNGGDAGTSGAGTDTEDFIKALNDAHYGGYSDWRMPTIKELAYIVNYSIPNPGPTIDTGYFPNTAESFYWSATTSAQNVFFWYPAWGVAFDGSDNHYGYKSSSYYVRAVRGGQTQSAYADNGDDTVTDTSTGLMWQKGGSSNTQTWQQALAYCEGLNLGDHTDWRLPTLKELQSLVDYDKHGPAINETYFPNAFSSDYWSSTTYADGTYVAWVVSFSSGDFYYINSYYDHCYKRYSLYVRAVRWGQSGPLGHLVISPASNNVTKVVGTATFSVSNTGTGTMPWTAAVTSGGTWLSITSDTSGTDAGTITCSFTANTSSSVRTATIRVTASGATGSPIDVTVTQEGTESLAASFVGSGLWIYNSSTAAWSQISSVNPESMIYSGSTLYAGFGTSYGLYKWDGTAWTQLTSANPENMVTSGATLYVNFGATNGLQKWNGTAWTQLTPFNPENMVTSGSTLYADFGASGLQKWDDTAWTQLTPFNPENMVTSGSLLYADFGALGLYRWDGAAWSRLTKTNPENMVTSGSLLYADFGATYGLYKFDDTAWTQLTPVNPKKMVASNSALYVNFGVSYGLQKWNGTAWTQLTPSNSENMVVSGSTLYVDFGALGLYKWNSTAWSQLTGSNPVIMAISN